VWQKCVSVNEDLLLPSETSDPDPTLKEKESTMSTYPIITTQASTTFNISEKKIDHEVQLKNLETQQGLTISELDQRNHFFHTLNDKMTFSNFDNFIF